MPSKTEAFFEGIGEITGHDKPPAIFRKKREKCHPKI